MRTYYTILSGILVAILSLGIASAQNDKGKINIKITKEIDGKKETLEKSYNSKAEMLADPEYQKFAGDDTRVVIGENDQDIFIEIEKLHEGDGPKVFHFSDDESDFEMIQIEEMMHLHEEKREEMESRRREIEKNMEELRSELEKMNRQDLIETMEKTKELMERSKMHQNNFIMELHSNLKVEDVLDDEFGKKGKVSPKEELQLEDLNFYPNPSRDRLKVRFRVEEEGPLSVKVVDMSGKEVYQTSYDRFSGIFHETIDLEKQNAGVYLLEIESAGKRTTKKIVKEK